MQFEMKVDLAVLQSLGINLYSNAAAVLSEIVANAWDADANEISIAWSQEKQTIVIQDDGSGMSAADLNQKYLKVGYQKRISGNDGLKSPRLSRPYMGRKGIGKLSVFSLADDIVIATRKPGETGNAIRLTRAELEEAISSGNSYHPSSEPLPEDLPPHGTRLTLTNLNSKRASVTIRALRRRLARRFDVLNYDPNDPSRFQIIINGEPIGFQDREDLKRIEYFWHLGHTDIQEHNTPKAKMRWMLDGTVDAQRGWKLEGWFGTVSTPEELRDEHDSGESLRNILILARKRPIQEGIIDQLHFNKIFGNYVTGQITAEFLDIDDPTSPDIATSDRQRLIEDDERVRLLKEKLREAFLSAERQWSEQRPRDKFKNLLTAYPQIHEWAKQRPQHRAAAQKLIGTIAALPLENEDDRKELFRAGILGFERIALEATTEDLQEYAEAVDSNIVMRLLSNQRDLEDALYGQIIRSRIAAIEQLEKLIDENELEKTLQEHLFANLWLLDPSWEHPTADPAMEISLARIRSDVFSPSEEMNQEQGRIDLKYRTATGKHIIVELKRYGRKTTLEELYLQGAKYWDAMATVLERRNRGQEKPLIEVVFVLGAKMNPGPIGLKTEEEIIAARLSAINGRVFYYDEMLENARLQYVKYDQALNGKNDGLLKILSSLDQKTDNT